MEPQMANGKICYLEIYAADVPRAAAFYETVFGWSIRKRDGGITSFDDTTGQVSGMWTADRKPNTSPGMIVYIMVFDIHKTMEAIEASGGRITEGIGRHAPEITATFSDPDGNVFGLYEEQSAKQSS
ncbi:VOC family protein [Deminuibacter soli]|uniref:VOC family protein n=1 Tax=Deminuibacter soli TaxID=2291815 RepID=A0A3E1NCV9_9BACT|nr:VOC family protein [Deminuibacter soli]RFM25667.1 VOC family protein [Deminuibacter soli]